jgi:DNA-binding transcriptional LysR family regulator
MSERFDRLRQLEWFRRVVEQGSISAAARALGTGQPAVSKQLRALEQRLGVRLLERTTVRLEATPAGKALYLGLPPLLEALDRLEDEVGASAKGLSGLLRIHVPVALGEVHLTRLLLAFQAENPRIAMDVIYDDDAVDLVKERVDIALRIGTLASPDLIVRKLAVLPRMLVASPRYLRMHGRPKTPQDLATHAFVRNARLRQDDHLVLRRGDEQVELALESRFLVNSVFAARELLLSDAGIGVASRWAVHRELTAGRLVGVLQGWAVSSAALHVVYPSATLKTKRVSALVEFLSERIVALPGFGPPSTERRSNPAAQPG